MSKESLAYAVERQREEIIRGAKWKKKAKKKGFLQKLLGELKK